MLFTLPPPAQAAMSSGVALSMASAQQTLASVGSALLSDVAAPASPSVAAATAAAGALEAAQSAVALEALTAVVALRALEVGGCGSKGGVLGGML